jgi:hypothetical protein
MKNLILTCFVLFLGTTAFSQSKGNKTVIATYEGFDGSMYSFYDDQEEYFLFDLVDPTVKESFDLESEELHFELFKVTYTEVKNEEGDILFKIIGLEIQSSEEEEF